MSVFFEVTILIYAKYHRCRNPCGHGMLHPAFVLVYICLVPSYTVFLPPSSVDDRSGRHNFKNGDFNGNGNG